MQSLADFSAYKSYMMAAFAAIGLLTCVFVQDFLAVRGLAVLALLLAKLMVDTGRLHLVETRWVLVIQIWAYVLIVAGIWFTVTPWKLRDFLTGFATASGKSRQNRQCDPTVVRRFHCAVLGLTAFAARCRCPARFKFPK